jgi:hypothetical protein
MTENWCVFCDLSEFRAAEVCIENAFRFERVSEVHMVLDRFGERDP